jgi:phosphonate transport system ATP-binding protein
MADVVIDVVQLRKTFGEHAALRGVSLQVERGEMVALLGASGSGKSTLLRHLNGLHRADADSHSQITVLGSCVQRNGRLGGDIRATRAKVAAIFQQFNLVDRLSVMSNVLAGALHRLPLWRGLLGRFPQAELQRAHEALRRVGIERCAWQRASTLSGGQQQRAAISRALVQGAQIILADEPIASLDPESSRRVMELLAQVNREFGVTVIVSLHQVDYAFAYCPRTVALRAGEVVHDGPTQELTPQRLRDLYGTQTDELLAPAAEQATPDLQTVPAKLLAA